ncbi:MAG: FAD-dependent oxidoreductase [Candidatus Sericytochromatia bacterium]
MKFLIIGGDAAGMSAAMQIKRRDPNVEITVLEKGKNTSYGACGIPYYFTGDVTSLDSLVVVTPEEFNKKGINVLINHEALKIDTKNKKVLAKNFDNELEINYDKLLIASGASPIKPDFKNVNAKGIFTIKNLNDAHNLDEYLKNNIKKAVIVGAGYIGLEIAEALYKKGLEITIIEKLSGVMGNINEKVNELVKKELESKNIKLLLDTGVLGFESLDDKVSSVLTEKENISTDLVILSLGVKPNTSFLKDSGIELGISGAIKVNEYLETNVEDVFSAGDCAESFHRVLRKNVFIPLALTANRQGRIAGANMVEKNEVFAGVLGSAATKIFDLAIARTGLDENLAKKENIPFKTVENIAGSKAHYYQGHKPVYIKLLYHSENYKVLGAILVGKDESLSKRSDIIATAISAGMTIKELSELDLSYAPPFSPVWDPILQVANKGVFSIK